MARIIKASIAKLLSYFHKPLINSQGLLKLVYIDVFYEGTKTSIGKTYGIYWYGINVGRLNLIFGRKGKIIGDFGNIGITIHPKHQRKGIATACTKFAISTLLTKQGWCQITTPASNIKMRSLLDKTDYVDTYNHDAMHHYIYRKLVTT